MPITYNNPTPQEVGQAIQGGPSETVDFLEGVVSVGRLGMALSGLANRNGGSILVGVRDQPRGIIPFDQNRLSWAFDKALAGLKPLPNVLLHPIDVGNRRVAVINVQPSPQVVVSPLGPFLREGAVTRMMTAEELRQRLPQVAGVPDLSAVLEAMQANTDIVGGLQEHIVTLQTTVIGLQSELRWSQRLLGQWKAILVSFGIGCVTGVIGNYIFKALGN